jgi:hypothetical protein
VPARNTDLFICVCVCLGDAPGEYKDLKQNDSSIRVEDGHLMIDNIQKNNEGYYLCEAINGIGSGLSAVILISVQGELFHFNKAVDTSALFTNPHFSSS